MRKKTKKNETKKIKNDAEEKKRNDKKARMAKTDIRKG